MKTIMGLTLMQPWAAAIVHGPKRIENRDWQPPAGMIGHYLAIHAGKKYDKRWETELFIWDQMNCDFPFSAGHVHSAIVGVARLKEVVEQSSDPWFFGQFGWVLDEVVAIDPIPCSGKQGLWTLPADVLACLRVRWRAANVHKIKQNDCIT
jgi:hypothetical protein